MDDSKERVLRPLGCLACLLDVLDPRTLLLRSRSRAAPGHPPTCDDQADLARCGHPNHAQTEHQATTFDAGDGTAPARAYERSLVSANVDADDALENSAATSMPWFPTRRIRTSCFEARGVRPGRTTAHRNPDAASSVRVVVDVPVVEVLIRTPSWLSSSPRMVRSSRDVISYDTDDARTEGPTTAFFSSPPTSWRCLDHSCRH
jgi:hypothetical protein